MPQRRSRLPSVSQQRFAQIPRAEIPRSRFDRSHGYKTTFDGGFLVPIFLDEALPGDTHSLRATLFARLATPLHPFMDNLHLETFFFAVPNRLVWENWQRFCGERDDPEDSIDFEVPTITAPNSTGWEIGNLADYFGLPTGVPGIQAQHLPFRAYQLIWNEWFRDQNLQDSASWPKGDGGVEGDPGLRRRGKRHDYFTSSLPWPQKGDPVMLPLGESAPILSAVPNAELIQASGAGTDEIRWTDGSANSAMRRDDSGGVLHAPTSLSDTTDLRYHSGLGFRTQHLSADLSDATAATINAIREAFQIQRLLERDARGGTRYTEIVLSHFGVSSPDSRLQRPEFLGGGSTPIIVNPVAATASEEDIPQGNLAGVGVGVASGHGFHKSFTEHTIIIGLVNVRADLTYWQGIERFWSRRTRYDFFWPALSHLGEQEVLSKEIFADGTEDDDDVWGYQERYAEYRYKPSRITGLFRPSASESLDIWHLSLDFQSRPELGPTFIEDNPPIERVIAVPTEPHFLLDCYFRYHCARPMPTYGVPGMVDHF